MSSNRVDEVWTEADLDMLLDLALRNTDESKRCHQAGCSLAALVMLASAFEASLLGMIIAHEEALRSNGLWPHGASHLHLHELARLARKRGWLTDDAVWYVAEVLNKARTMAAHPGAYVRGMRQMPEEHDMRAPEGYEICLQIVQQAGSQLRTAHHAVMRRGRGRSRQASDLPATITDGEAPQGSGMR